MDYRSVQVGPLADHLNECPGNGFQDETTSIGGATGMIALTPGRLSSVAVIGAQCGDIIIGAGATLIEIARSNPEVTVHALVLTGGGTEREVEEKSALAALWPSLDVRLMVADLPSGRLSDRWSTVKHRLAELRSDSRPDLVFGPQRHDFHHDHRVLAELIPTEFRNHLVLGYEILGWESTLPNPSLYQTVPPQAAQRKTRLLTQYYPSQAGDDWFDDEAFLGLMRVRGTQCHARYAEAFVADKAMLTIS